MAYTGGTIQIAPRLKKEHLAWLHGHCDNVNFAINSALSQFLHKVQFDRISESTKEWLYGKTLHRLCYSYQEREKKSVRLMRQHIDYMKLNGIVVGRCLDLAIEEYINAGGNAARRNYNKNSKEATR